MKIEVSNGEILDKYTILEIKLDKIKNPKKTLNVQNEFNTLRRDVERIYNFCKNKKKLKNLQKSLLEINKKLWVIEDAIRECERANDFGQAFIDLARAVYHTNDDRSDVKKEINLFTSSYLVEEKSYKDYKSK